MKLQKEQKVVLKEKARSTGTTAQVDKTPPRGNVSKTILAAVLLPQFGVGATERDDDMTNFSLAPLNTMEEQVVRFGSANEQANGRGNYCARRQRRQERAPSQQIDPPNSNASSCGSSTMNNSKTSSLLSSIRQFTRKWDHGRDENQRKQQKNKTASSSSTAATALLLLEKERRSAREELKRRELLERQEQERIAFKKQAYLEQQRAREAEAGGRSSPSLPPSLPLVRPARPSSSSTELVAAEESTITSKGTAGKTSRRMSALPLCVICSVRERTHIATPCGHFSFCGECALNTIGRTMNRLHAPSALNRMLCFAAYQYR